MLELIAHARFRAQGVPVDLGPYHNHGTAHATAAVAGVDPSKSAVAFPSAASAITVPKGERGQWAPLIALRIRAVINVDAMAARTQTLVECAGGLRLGIMEGALEAGYPGTGATYVRSDSTYAPDAAYHPVPSNRWVAIEFDHDGYSRMRLRIDGQVVGVASVGSGVPPVQAPGVRIGNDAAGTTRWHGAIDELMVWRLDPHGMEKEFLCRPYTRATAHCWEEIFRASQGWGNAHPSDLATLMQAIAAGTRPFVRALFALPPAEQKKMRDALARCRALWCQGRMDTPQMEQALRDWRDLLRRHDLDSYLDGAQIRAAASRVSVDPKLRSLACDPKVAAFLQRFEPKKTH